MLEADKGEQPMEMTGTAESPHEAVAEGESLIWTGAPSTGSQKGAQTDQMTCGRKEDDMGS